MRIAVLGRTRMLYDAAEALRAAGHDIVLITTCRAVAEYDVREDDFRRLAESYGADFLQTQTLNTPEVIGRLRAARAEIGVSVNWINLVGPEASGAFPRGVINAHAGDLPRFRGNAPVGWAILLGEPRVTVSIHQMEPDELDAGAIALQDHFPLDDRTYIGDVFAWLDRRVPGLFVETIDGIERGTVVFRPQPDDPSLALRGYPRRPEDGAIDWRADAVQLGRLVRASAEPYSGAFCDLEGTRVTVWRARSAPWPCPSLAIGGQVVSRDAASGNVAVAARNGMLVLEEVEPAGGQRMRPSDLVRSLRTRFGSGR